MSAIRFGRRAAPSLFLVLFAAPSFSEDLGGLSPLTLDSLQREQFAASETGEGLEAPNPAHEFRTRFDAASIELAPQLASSEGESWSMTWRTTRWGRIGAEMAPGEASRAADGPRVEYRYASGLAEWYVNRHEGLEQGFAVPGAPASGARWFFPHGRWMTNGDSGGPAAAGVYFVRVTADDEVATKKVVRVK